MFWLLLYSFLVLVANLRGYKNQFKSKKRIVKELDETLDKMQKESKLSSSEFKGLYIVVGWLYIIFYAVFYMLVWLHSDNLLMTVYSAVMMLLLIYNINPLFSAITERKYKISWTRYISTPFSTIYIVMFIYFILTK